MTLPSITAPSTVPAFLVGNHSIEQGDAFANVANGSGHGRKRRVSTTQLRRVVVEWLLTEAQMQAVDDWVENGLLAYSRPFAARVANEGLGTVWWRAKWLAPYTADPINTGGKLLWHVTGQIVLSDDPAPVGPVVADLAMEMSASLTGSAFIAADSDLAMEMTATLVIPSSLALECVAHLTAPSIGIVSPLVGGLGLQGGTPTVILQSATVKVVQLAASDESTGIIVGQLVKFPILDAMRLSRVVATLNVAQATGAIFTVDVRVNGASILSTLLTIDNTELTSATAATPYVLSSTLLSVDDVVSIHCTQAGDGTGAGLKIGLVGGAP